MHWSWPQVSSDRDDPDVAGLQVEIAEMKVRWHYVKAIVQIVFNGVIAILSILAAHFT